MTKNIAISQLAEMLKERGHSVNTSALRYWESEGYLRAERTEGGHRLFLPEEAEKALLLSLASRLRKKLTDSPLSDEKKCLELYSNVLEYLKTEHIDMSRVKAYQKMLTDILERLELDSSITASQSLPFGELGLSELDVLQNVIVPEGDCFSGDEAVIARSVQWEEKWNPGLMSELPHISNYAWMNVRLGLQSLPPTDIAGQLARRYEQLLVEELSLSDVDVVVQAELMLHELFAGPSGLKTLREIRSIFSLLKAKELVRMLLADPRTRDGLLMQLARRLERITSMEWESYYTEWSGRNQMPSAQGYVAYLRKQHDFLDGKLSDEARAKQNLHHISVCIDGIEQKLMRDTRRQGVSVSVIE